MNAIKVKWNQIYTQGITLSTSTKINTLGFADDQVIMTLLLLLLGIIIIIIRHYFPMQHPQTGLYELSTLCSL
jgi:hypothetical protein